VAVADGDGSLPLSVAAGVLAAVAAGVLTGSSTRALVWTGAGISVGSCDADAAAADADPFSVGPWHSGLTLVRCVLSVGAPVASPSGAPDVSVGVGSDDPVGVVGDSVGEAGSVVGVIGGELWSGVTVGLAAVPPDLPAGPEVALADGTGLARLVQVALGLGDAVVLAP
jgi:hypothetical protein